MPCPTALTWLQRTSLMKINLALLFPTAITKSYSFYKKMGKVIG
jgi:hypothetical protein